MNLEVRFNHRHCHPETCCHKYNYSLWDITDPLNTKLISQADLEEEIYLLKENYELKNRLSKLQQLYIKKLEKQLTTEKWEPESPRLLSEG